MSQIPSVESRFSDLRKDIHPRTWLSVYHKTSFSHIFLMFLFYSGIGMAAATSVWSVQLYLFDYEEPIPDVSLLSGIVAGPFEETLFFGLPYAISGNTYVVLITGAVWSASHLLNTQELLLNGLVSFSSFAFTIPHIFFSLRTWKSGKGWYTIILHSSWNVIIVIALIGLDELPSMIVDTSSTIGLFGEISNIVIAGVLIGITYPLYKLRMKKEAEKRWVVGPHQHVKRNRSWWWLVLPLFIGIFGGLISYFAIRKDDARKAKICLYVGIIIVAAPFVWNFAFTGEIPYLSGTPSYEPPETIKGLDLGGKIGSFSINDNTNMIYVVTSTENEINPELLVIDGSTNKIVDNFHIDTTLSRPILKIQPATNFLYIIDNYGNYTDYKSKIHIIDLNTKQRISTYDFKGNSHPITFLEDSDIFYVNHVTHNSLSVIDNSKNSVIKTISVGQNPSGLAYNPNTNLVYSSSFTSHAIDVIDTTSHKVIDKIKFEYAPGDMEIDLDTNLIYVANGGYYTNKGTIVSILDGSSHQVLKTIELGDWPNEMELNPITNTLYVQKHNDRTIAVIDTNTNEVIRNIELYTKPMHMDINLGTNQVYLAGYFDDLLAVIDGKTNTLLEFENPEKVKELSSSGA